MEVYIIGCGGNSKIVYDICSLNSYDIMGYFDDSYDENIGTTCYGGKKIIGKVDDVNRYENINIINSIGDNFTRKEINDRFQHKKLTWINCIHPDAYISPTSSIACGNIICCGAVINSDSNVGNFNLINTYAVIEHDTKIGNYNHICPRTTICGGVIIGTLNLIGASSTIIPCECVGSKNIIGAMTVIINSIDNLNVVVGNPGKIIKKIQDK